MHEEWVDVGPASGSDLFTRPNEHPVQRWQSDIHTDPFYQKMSKRAADLLTSRCPAPIFHTNMDGIKMNAVFENALSPENRQEFNCRACAHFMNKFGDLCLVDESTGKLIPLFWTDNVQSLPGIFQDPVKAINQLFDGRTVGREFRITKERCRYLGVQEKGGFKHMAFDLPSCRSEILPAAVARTMPPTNEQREMLCRILNDYSRETVRRVASLLQENRLPYADAHKGAISWLLDVQKARGVLIDSDTTSATERHNIQTHVAASAFIGCLHQLRSGALSKLLDGVQEGKPFNEQERQWRTLCDPTMYMRPQQPPKAGNIAVAEKLFAELGLTKDDMRRKYLTPSQIPDEVYMYRETQASLQTPKDKRTMVTRGIFAGVVPRSLVPKLMARGSENSAEMDPPKSISFSNFIRTVLPTARRVELQIKAEEYLYFFITGHPDSKPLMQWHTADNLISPYTFTRPVATIQYNLPSGWTRVSAIIPFPHLWDSLPATKTFPLAASDSTEFNHQHRKHGFTYLLCLNGIQATKDKMGLCLFPSMLKSEFHPVRATIEAYSHDGEIDREDGCDYVGGICVSRSSSPHTKRVYRVTDMEGDRRLYETALFE
ncbi:hypothetical protein PAAG_06114 [Paracoccidioides lutzii Pb01]|uniref:Uncharacterized protein n=1 Tax=Paracoccidioides lutzii (strain ATCC MYA-826 / Pb01) TaxID=502779 RepID=C1H604_PARBA|nr:hypothetical protein PAAG_06114 [Paracoccidioides lutzii Pb01]EEH35067.2 hypothetical protein PAAG_06114 [Paracoccidioides lutzii Pb01]